MDDRRRKLIADVLGVCILAFTLFIALSLATYNHSDPSFNSYLSGGETVKNKAGIIGATIADTFAQTAGVSAILFIIGLGYLAALIISGAPLISIAAYTAGLFLLSITISSMVNMTWGTDPLFSEVISGGLMGKFAAQKAVMPWFGPYGSYIIFTLASMLSILVMFRLSVASAVKLGARFGWVAQKWMLTVSKLIWRVMTKIAKFRPPLIMDTSEEGKSIRNKKVKIMEKEFARNANIETSKSDYDDEDEIEKPLPAPKIVDCEFNDEDDVKLPPPPTITHRAAAKTEAKSAKKKEPEDVFQQEIFEFDNSTSEHEFPSLKLLDYEAKVVVKQSKEELIRNSRILEKKLMDFGIEGRVTQVLPGPVITIFEFEPAPGVKVSRIVSLADDLAMSLRAMSIRVVAPIPGKSVVGIEVPNGSREPVFLKEILSTEEFQKDSARIPLALGKDVAGKPVVADLASIPHLLIAGSTGSGKSVGINAMICSVLFRLTPSDAKFIMIDPKMLELSIYDGIPHLIAPVVTNPKKASNALRWVVGEMERRYALLSELGVRNIDGFNKMVAEKGGKLEYTPRGAKPVADADGEMTAPSQTLEKLPYIVVVIDELADLMMVASKDVEDALARLAQMARAAGIHLIVATQRPSVDVLTGLIKANFPARMSFQVRSRVDSRTIIDSMGAEKLLGKGDMLYLPPGDAKLNRIQGPFVSDEEIHRVVNFLKAQRKPEYNEDILKAPADDPADGESLEDDMDEFYDQAVDLVARTKQVSISMIQRRLRIGYNRAARIVEVMEKQGLVGPADGVKPREVFVRPVDDMEPQYN